MAIYLQNNHKYFLLAKILEKSSKVAKPSLSDTAFSSIAFKSVSVLLRDLLHLIKCDF